MSGRMCGKGRPVPQALQRFAEEPLCCRGVARRREVKVDRIAELVDGSIEVGPLATDFDVGFVDAPARRSRLTPLPAQTSLDLWRILLDPAIDCAVVDRDTTLTHHLLKVAIAHAVAAVPPDCPEHDHTLEVATLEV